MLRAPLTHPSDPTHIATSISFTHTARSTKPTMSKGTQTVFGGAQFQREGRFADPSTLLKVYDALERSGVRKIDTAHIYGAS